MPIEFSCTCQRTLRVPDAHAGKKVRCPGCGVIQPIPVPVVVEEVVEAVSLDEPKKKKKKKPKKSARERELELARRDYEGEGHLYGKPTHGSGGLTLFGIHITAAVISGFVLLIVGLTAMIIIKASPEMGLVAGPRMFLGSVACTTLGGILLIKAFLFGSEE